MHPDMAVRHAIASTQHAKFNRRTSGPVNTVLHPLGHLTQVIVTGDALAPSVGDTDHRPF